MVFNNVLQNVECVHSTRVNFVVVPRSDFGAAADRDGPLVSRAEGERELPEDTPKVVRVVQLPGEGHLDVLRRLVSDQYRRACGRLARGGNLVCAGTMAHRAMTKGYNLLGKGGVWYGVNGNQIKKT